MKRNKGKNINVEIEHNEQKPAPKDSVKPVKEKTPPIKKEKPVVDPVAEKAQEKHVEPKIESKLMDSMEEISTDEIISPLNDVEREEKPYGKDAEVIFEFDNDGNIQDIPEPKFERPTINQKEIEDRYERDFRESQDQLNGNDNEVQEQQQAPKKPSAWDNVTNSSMNELPKKEQKQGAELLVNFLIETHKSIYKMGYNWLNMDEEKIKKLIMRGKLDPMVLRLEFPVDEESGEMITVAGFIMEYNKALKIITAPDENFYNSIRPPLLREFTKRGWGLTDMEYILVELGKKTATDISQLIGAKMNLNLVFRMGADFLESQKPAQAAPVPPKTEKQNTSTAPPAGEQMPSHAKVVEPDEVKLDIVEDEEKPQE